MDSCALCGESKDLEDYTVYTAFLTGLTNRAASSGIKRTASYAHFQSHIYQVCGHCRNRARSTYIGVTAFTSALCLGSVALFVYSVSNQLVFPAFLALFLGLIAFVVYVLLIKRFRIEEKLVDKAVASRGKHQLMPATGFTESQYKRLKTTG